MGARDRQSLALCVCRGGIHLIAEIVTIGTELLLGEIVDSNAAHIARELATIGVDHYYTTTVGDNEERIVLALRTALSRSEVVIVTGGLGPTVDDMTRQAVARVAGCELVLHPELLAQIEAFFRSRGAPMTDNNRQQAYIPAGAIVLENPVGTAPAFISEVEDKAIICLPGVPHEMAYLLRERVLPYLSTRMGQAAVIVGRMVHTVAMGESVVDQAIADLMHSANPSVGTRAHPGQTDVCITAKAQTRDEALRLLEAMEVQVRQRLGSAVYGVDEETLAGVVAAALQARRWKLALGDAETGGLVARKLWSEAGGPEAVPAVRVASDGRSLARDLGIPPVTDSEEMASAVASALCQQYQVDLGLAIVEGQEPDRSLYVALATSESIEVRHWPSRGRSEHALGWTLHLVLDTVRYWLLDTGAVVRA
jgi:nicotinamide-nucleotide amidase